MSLANARWSIPFKIPTYFEELKGNQSASWDRLGVYHSSDTTFCWRMLRDMMFETALQNPGGILSLHHDQHLCARGCQYGFPAPLESLAAWGVHGLVNISVGENAWNNPLSNFCCCQQYQVAPPFGHWRGSKIVRSARVMSLLIIKCSWPPFYSHGECADQQFEPLLTLLVWLVRVPPRNLLPTWALPAGRAPGQLLSRYQMPWIIHWSNTHAGNEITYGKFPIATGQAREIPNESTQWLMQLEWLSSLDQFLCLCHIMLPTSL